MSVVEVLSPDHPFRAKLGFAAAATRSHYDEEAELISADSTPFASAPSSPSRSKANDFFYSAPPSPSRGFDTLESLFKSTTLQESSLFHWHGTPSSPNGSSSALDLDNLYNPSGFRGFGVNSTPRNPSQGHAAGFKLSNDQMAQLRDAADRNDASEEDFRFSSEFDDGAFAQMSSADELFFKGKILPLIQPHTSQKQSQEFVLPESGMRYLSVSAPSSPLNERVSGRNSAAGARSRLGLKNSSTEAKNAHEGSSRQGWAKALAKSMLFRKSQKMPQPHSVEAAAPSAHQQMKKRTDFTKKLDASVDQIRTLRVDDALQNQSVKAQGNHVGGRDVSHQSSHHRHVGADLQDVPETAEVKKWYDKDGDKRMKNAAARSWPRPSARSVLVTRSSRDATSSKQGSLAAPLEMHYRNNPATSEQMRRRTFLPYKESLLGCLGLGGLWVPGLSSAFDSVGR